MLPLINGIGMLVMQNEELLIDTSGALDCS